jgi:transposase
MRKIVEILRLKYACGLKHRRIARSVGIARSTVCDYLRRAAAAGLSWPLPESMTEAEVDRLLFPPTVLIDSVLRPEPDWATVHQELRRKGVTLVLLWQEYKAAHPEGFRYSWFCHSYRAWAGKLDVVMRQEHRAGEKLFVDYAGQTVALTERATGEIRQAQIFVAVLGASNYTYAEATWTQQLPDWIGAHARAFEFLGGVPEVVVPDNLKSAVARPCRYDPDLNPTYREFARHYQVAIVPARVARPRDKAKVEAGVLLVERWILARLRHRQFFSLAELNAAIAELLNALNARAFKKLPGSRASQFAAIDQPALRALPVVAYQYAEWSRARVHIDYHVELARRYYSAPHVLIGRELEVRLTERTVELFQRGERVASHARLRGQTRYSTQAEHMPAAHRAFAQWTPDRLVRWAQSIGVAAAALIERMLAARRHPQQGFRACLGILRLGKHYGEARLEAACTRALAIGATNYRSVESILKHRLDQNPLPEATNATLPLFHDNIRGPDYYH